MGAAFSFFQCGDSKRARGMLEDVVGALESGPARAHALIRLALVRGYDDDLRAAEALLRRPSSRLKETGSCSPPPITTSGGCCSGCESDWTRRWSTRRQPQTPHSPPGT